MSFEPEIRESCASSSRTVVPNDPSRPPTTSHSLEDLEKEIRREDDAVAMYGGDDPHEPPPKEDDTHSTRTQTVAHHFEEEKVDPWKVQWDGPDDPEDPQNWSVGYKWFLTAICCLLTVNVTFASSAPSSATEAIAADFGVSVEVANLITSLFLCGYICGPLLWAPGSELVGRRPIFIGTMITYSIFQIGQALAPNIQTLLITRFFAGVFASAPLTNCGGVIADIWNPIGRGKATSIFTAAVFVGPVCGPIVGGFVAMSYLGWRWIFWLIMIFSAACWAIATVWLPETFSPVILQRRAKRLRAADPERNKEYYAEHEKQDWSWRGVLKRTLFRPFHMLFLEPILLLVTVYLSIVYGLLYALFNAFPIIFVTNRGFNLGENGLAFISVGIGAVIGSILNNYTNSHYPKLMVKWRGHPPPEERLYGAMIAGICLVIGIFWLGWTGNYASVPWYVPALGAIVFGTSISLVFMSFLSYLVDTYLMYSASAFAANTVCRSAVAAGFPLFTTQMFDQLGVNWAATLIGCVGLVLAPSPFLFYKYGARIRARSRFAPCIDLKIAKELQKEEEAARNKETNV